MIATEKLHGSWNKVRGEIKKRWGQLTDSDLEQFSGDVDALVGEIQFKTGESREAIEHFLEQMTTEGASAVGRAGEAAKQYATHAAEGMVAASGHLAEGVRAGYARNQEFVRHRPGESVAIAFATGLIVGFSLGLMTRSH